jgi:hypothetical protein
MTYEESSLEMFYSQRSKKYRIFWGEIMISTFFRVIPSRTVYREIKLVTCFIQNLCLSPFSCQRVILYLYFPYVFLARCLAKEQLFFTFISDFKCLNIWLVYFPASDGSVR